MNEAIKSKYNERFSEVFKVYEIFKDFFGEDKVDLQGLPNIETYNTSDIYDEFDVYVHWPEVTITNEHNQSVDIKELYSKVPININGTLKERFKLNRAHYQLSHLVSDYQHSHTPGVPFENLSSFREPCTGTGPINNTMASLMVRNEEYLWQLFCRELDVYVHVESLSGGPYRRLERIYKNVNLNNCYPYNSNPYNNILLISRVFIHENQLNDFYRFLIHNDILQFGYNNGIYTIGNPRTKLPLLISNAFISWYNSSTDSGLISIHELFAENILVKCINKNGILYQAYNTGIRSKENLLALANTPLFTFKDKTIYLEVEDDCENREEVNIITLLSSSAINSILHNILLYINEYYGK